MDLGAAEGYYSAFFSATADRPSRIVAVELSPEMCRLHSEVLKHNRPLSGQPVEWTVHQVAITAVEADTTLGEGFGAGLVCWYDSDPTRPVKTTTLQSFLAETSFVPDLIKIDIESYEYEVVTSSIGWLAEHRPNLHFELHSQMMRERGHSPEQLMRMLLGHYQIVDSVPKDWPRAPISRIGLTPLVRRPARPNVPTTSET
jgi:FkbM family methyltransferase